MAGTSLRQRAQQQPTADVDRPNDGPTLTEQIKKMEGQFALAMPRGAEAAQLVRDALTTLKTTPRLGECSPQSVLGGLMTCAQLGLRPGVLGHAWLLPFYDTRSRSYQAQLVVGYQGLVELAHRSGRISSLIARTVYERDTFDVDYGLRDSLIHKPAISGTRGEPVAYYAIAKFTSGGHAFIVMTHDEMLEYRDQYAKARNREGQIVGPWRDEFEGMALKTCVRQLSKWMPKSTELANAITADNSVRVDLTPDVEPGEASHHYGDAADVVDGHVVEQPVEQPDDTRPPGEHQPSAEEPPTEPAGW